jgi:CubicO group peptidase (beta-lactamase class C family)
MMKRTLPFLVAISVLVASCATVPSTSVEPIRGYPEAIDRLRVFAAEALREEKVAGMSIALVADGEVVWSDGFGYADRSAGTPAGPDTVYGVGSISKLFTATAVMQLVERGMIDLDAPVSRYIEEFAINSRFGDTNRITVRTLLTHHSGIPGDKPKGFVGETDVDFRDIVDYLSGQYTAYPPDYLFAYCNLGIDLVGVIVERVSGETFIDYVDRHILDPLRMERASFVPLSSRSDLEPSLVAKAHRRGVRASFDEPPLRDIPAGSLNASASGLARFMLMVLGGGELDGRRIVEAATLAEMLSPQNGEVELDFGFEIGIGYFLTNPRLEHAGRFAGHGGDTFAYHAALGMLPDYDLGVVVLTNTDSGGAIATKVADEALHLLHTAKTGAVQREAVAGDDSPGPWRRRDTAIASAEDLERYPGEYATQVGRVSVRRAASGDSLSIVVNGKQYLLVPEEDRWFSFERRALGLIPVRRSDFDDVLVSIREMDGSRIVVLASDGWIEAVGESIVPEAIPASWSSRIGAYRAVGEYTDIERQYTYPARPELSIEGGFLTLRLWGRRGPASILIPVNDSEAIVAGLGRSARETVLVRIVDGREVIEYWGYRLERESGR